MLETIREYASERLAEEPDFHASVRLNHATYYVDYSQQQWKHLTGIERESALKDFEANLENVRIAWRYWVSEKNLGQLQKLTDCLWLLYDARGWYWAIVELTTDLLDVIGSAPSSTENYKQEIVLQTSLGRVLMAIKGCTPEVESIYKGALELCERYGEIPNSFPILRALASFYTYLGQMDKSKSFGEQILGLAEQLDDDYMKIEGHLILGFSTAFSGDLHKGLEYLEKGIAIYKPALSKSKSFRFGNNPGLICYTTSAMCSWMLGYPERSSRFIKQVMVLSETLDHPSSKIYVLFHSGLLHHFKGEHAIALKYAKMALHICDNQEFHIWKAVVTCLHGAALASIGETEEGMAEFTHGLEKYAELNTPPIFWPMLLFIKAGVYIHSNKFEEGLDILDEASAILGQDSGNPILSELFRLKGEILLSVEPDELEKAETLFKHALEIAELHGAVAFELRAAVSLSRLWIRENKTEQSREIMNKAVEKFTEGFETEELKEAKALIELL
jgi:adenylate cyclase